MKLDFDPLNPDAKLAAPQTAKEWATARLADKLYQGSPTAAIYADGQGTAEGRVVAPRLGRNRSRW